ncbi:MAG: S1-like domain-containing RNA-binding protein [Prevotella sp.]|nr:S1-like domain-containing RNA-binding protein [Prevotella sp.]
MTDIRLGDYCSLVVTKRVDFGLYLDGGKAGEILLPARYVPEGASVGDTIRVFIYLDQDERIIATTQEPKAKAGDFAFLRVNWVNEYGAFLDWGLMKDLFCPFREQRKKMVKGENYIVHVHIDEDSYRIMASAKVDKYINKDTGALAEGEEVDLLVWHKTELGFNVIINNEYAGLIYDNRIFSPLRTGDRLKGYIQKKRSDGKVDVSLQPSGRRQTKDFAHVLETYLDLHGGYCAYGDKSDAGEIYAEFGVSKKVFKKAVGNLYRRHVVTIRPDGLYLNKAPVKTQ